jgi:hypothetical protein
MHAMNHELLLMSLRCRMRWTVGEQGTAEEVEMSETLGCRRYLVVLRGSPVYFHRIYPLHGVVGLGVAQPLPPRAGKEKSESHQKLTIFILTPCRSSSPAYSLSISSAPSSAWPFRNISPSSSTQLRDLRNETSLLRRIHYAQ